MALADRDEALDWFRQEDSAVGPAVQSLEDPRLLRPRGRFQRRTPWGEGSFPGRNLSLLTSLIWGDR
ncbi:hypothetical protein V2W30_01220 [Streptomyces sp. Q6]|uniref:Uncharacterized protein n=1 Tax=Streptomyces citrinus TaxID=3118173 RepID=A0ACD5A4K6_9ACTN